MGEYFLFLFVEGGGMFVQQVLVLLIDERERREGESKRSGEKRSTSYEVTYVDAVDHASKEVACPNRSWWQMTGFSCGAARK